MFLTVVKFIYWWCSELIFITVCKKELEVVILQPHHRRCNQYLRVYVFQVVNRGTGKIVKILLCKLMKVYEKLRRKNSVGAYVTKTVSGFLGGIFMKLEMF